ncbi:M48 family peptidase [Rhodohalobacter sp. SW132]|uniref:M48 family metallopeptidase n=1 Tax=Rhodohalobacter sp. SW132 TaxID=2293433 RepID=UPI000E221AB7|nr:M48 family metallopeptidase [Rhodohalobacter sp. SW132]REL38378.1 M48 family peptidase [Rhodohalobacter sp. SW132]
MNIFTIIILAAILIDFTLGIISNRLNLKALSRELPDEFEDVYDEQTYAKSQEYTRVNTRFGFLTGTVDLLLLLAFWFAGGFNWLDQWARGFEFGVIGTGLIFIGALVVAKIVISLPFSVYSTFVIEERFGFNKTDGKTFVMDRLKGMMLSLLIGAPLLAGIIAFFEYGGTWAWVYAWLAVTAFSLVMQYIAPTWIMPLFNKFEPLEDGELRQAIEAYAEKVDFPLQGIYVMDGSKRSSKSNAFFTGFGKNKRIALFDTLIENHTTEELVAVLAHEIGHYKKKHIVKNMVISTLHTGIMFALLSIFLQVPALFDAFFMEEMSVYAGLLFFGLLYSPVETLLGIFMQMMSRKHEFEADHYAASTTGQPEQMVNVLKKLSKDNLSNLTPHPFYVFLNYSHPPVLRRIESIRRSG